VGSRTRIEAEDLRFGPQLPPNCHSHRSNQERPPPPTLPTPARLVMVAPDGSENERIRVKVQIL
jgi:hypothetical protein